MSYSGVGRMCFDRKSNGSDDTGPQIRSVRIGDRMCLSRDSLMDDYKLTELFCPASFGLFALAVAVDQSKFQFRDIAKWVSLGALASCFISAALTRCMLARTSSNNHDVELAGPHVTPRHQEYSYLYTLMMRTSRVLTLMFLTTGICALVF